MGLLAHAVILFLTFSGGPSLSHSNKHALLPHQQIPIFVFQHLSQLLFVFITGIFIIIYYYYMYYHILFLLLHITANFVTVLAVVKHFTVILICIS